MRTDILDGVVLTLRGFRGGFFSGFYVSRDSHTHGPGWYVFGRNPAYGGHYVMCCARPDVPMRRHPHYNGRVMRGWHTRRDAQRVADVMNQRDADTLGAFAHLPLHGTVFKESSDV